MVEPAFPVLFFDGDKETDIGDVQITPFFLYKPFQHLLSNKIGISPNQISIYFVNRHRDFKPPSPSDRLKIPITAKANFAFLCRQRGWSFYVVLKRSRKSRNHHRNLILLRRDQIYQSTTALLLRNLKNVQKKKEEDSSDEFGWNLSLDSFHFPTIEDIYGAAATTTTTVKSEDMKSLFCVECWNAKNGGAGETTTSFHHCVNDEVITHSYARLAPINRPIGGVAGS